MTLSERINADFILAFKGGVETRDKKNFLGVIKAETTKESKEPTDEFIIAKLRGYIKKHNESISEFGVPSMTDMELEIVNGYLPQLMDETLIRSIIESYKNTGITDMGKLMGEFNKTYKGKADNNLVSKVVKEALV